MAATEIKSESVYEPDNLWAGMGFVAGKSMPGLLAQGESVVRGTILTMVSGKLKAVTTKTQTVYGIAVEAATATDGDLEIPVIVQGELNAKALKTGTVTDSSTVADYLVEARNVGLIFRNLD